VGTGTATILLTDDDADTLKVLSECLRDCGFNPIEASSGPMCLERARAGGIDVVLLDLMMPQMDGYEVCAALKGDATTREIPVIVLTACDDARVRARMMSLGAAEFLVKPVLLAELQRRIANQLEARSVGEGTRSMLNKLPSR
jgi:CheY-like chemotaxis protein